MSFAARLSTGIINTIVRRNYVLLSTVFVGAFAAEIAYDKTTNALWDSWNRGRQWKDIKHKYLVKEEEDEDDE